ncbi:Aspartyl/glutamyl-tRNA (Asn/Gln) amidotransferase subunit B [Gossypium arboreum]|uniref:Aspartyl/glutamyl-tRNA (Asn/Gln) amidotransferase subunit B n=1 Tax=Gossypium arboreum TaxID=29729 RepID=A0A0B0PS50_GOSAR|nr:Aspartyl/glutamyl-tRNA (Asn/Gln) amidotransferase subunit B [Gossypium arboreum]
MVKFCYLSTLLTAALSLLFSLLRAVPTLCLMEFLLAFGIGICDSNDSPLVLMIGRERETELAEEKNSSKYNLISDPGY